MYAQRAEIKYSKERDNEMRLGKFLSSRTKSELEVIKESLNLTDDEILVFTELSRGRSITCVAEHCGISESTASYRIKAICDKLKRI